MVAGFCFAATACGSKKGAIAVGIVTPPPAANPAQLSNKSDTAATCLSTDQVKLGVKYVCANGKARVGTLASDAELNSLSAGDIRKGVVIGAITGAYPSAEFPLDGALADVADLNEFSPQTLAGTYEFFDSVGTRKIGVVTAASEAIPALTDTTVSSPGLLTSVVVRGSSGLVAQNIKAGVTLFGVSGSINGIPATCVADGVENCVTTNVYKSASITGLASKILSGESVAGVSGNVVLPATSAVRTATTYGASGATSGTLANCGLDGATDCVATMGFPAANLMVLSPGSIKNGITIGGVTGQFPSTTYRLPGATATNDLTSLTSTHLAGTYEFFDSAGQRATGDIVDPAVITPGTAAQNFLGTAGLYRSISVQGDAALLASNIRDGVTLFTVAGNVVLPAASAVRNTTTFGAASATTGTLADCAADGATGCVVPAASATYKAANVTGLTGWDLRRKRNSDGTLATFAGLVGLKRECRNGTNTTLWDNITSPGTMGLDIFDTIEDGYGVPSQIPPWLIPGVAGDHRSDFKCGGIVATGSSNTGNTGADATLAYDTDGNWQDLTPGLKPDGTPSFNTADGCNHAEKMCVFRDLSSGLMVTEVQAANDIVWSVAQTTCDTLGDINPVPIIGGSTYSDWRVPTQKELMWLHVAGIRSLNPTVGLTARFGELGKNF